MSDSKKTWQQVTFERLVSEATESGALEPPAVGMAPALECLVMLRGAQQAFRGSLSTTPEGGLRMLSPQGPRDNKLLFAEMFFAYEDVAVLSVIREMEAVAAPLIRMS